MRPEPREAHRLAGWREDIAAATALAVFLAAIGPFGSFLNGPFWQRLIFQLVCCWAAVVLIGAGVRLAIARFKSGPWLWAALAATAAIAMAPVAGLNILMAHLLWPFVERVMTPAKWYGEGLLIAEPASFAFAWLALRRRAKISRRDAAAADAGAPRGPGLLAAEPGAVLCLRMEDHYVRVHTARGAHLVLATFGQAIAALAGTPGLRAHRSWWVADQAVVGVEWHGRNLRLRLVNGLAVPVARSAVAEARARGWLERTARG